MMTAPKKAPKDPDPVAVGEMAKLAQDHTRQACSTLSHQHAFERCVAREVEVNTVIDLGAAKGGWSSVARKYWPDAHYHLVEAKEYWRPALEKVTARTPNTSFTIAAVSDTPGTVYFPADARPYGGRAINTVPKKIDVVEIPATSIDEEVRKFDLKPPFFIKMDTHGTELDILKGARETLPETQLLCIEMYNFGGQRRFFELIGDLEEMGFACVDIAEPLFRYLDACLWQIDVFLMPSDSDCLKKRMFWDPATLETES